MKKHFLLIVGSLMAVGFAQADGIASKSQLSRVNHQHPQLSQIQDVTERPPMTLPELTTYPRLKRFTMLSDAAIPNINESCSVTEFTSRTGRSLTDYVTGVSSGCINKQFSVTSADAANIFNENNMLTITDSFRSASRRYKGNKDDNILNLVLFLRAGYYTQFYQRDAVGEYSDAIKQSSLIALDEFFKNEHFTDVTDEHGKVLSEVLTLVDSSGHNADFIYIVKDMLARFDNSWNDSRNMSASINSVFTILWRGQWADDFAEHLAKDNSIVDALKVFIDKQDYLIGTDNEYLINNAAKELGRMLNYAPSVQNKVKPYLLELLRDYSMSGRGTGIWLAAAEMVDYYSNCEEYNICGYKKKLEQQVLPISYTCSPTIQIRAQSMTQGELKQSCEKMAKEEIYFHAKLNTGYQPVTDDHNSALEVVIFNDATNYKQYAGTFFGISTDNGGMYLEGEPSVPNNQARFIAHEADWITDRFEVWNLKHEYIHYLDGRYNIKGNFNDSTKESTIWWIEGLAEYISHGDDNSDAIEVGKNNNYQLNKLFMNDYNSGQERVYRGGYLAVRYMFEKHAAEVNNILNELRQGNFSNYASYMLSMGDIYNADFSYWLTELGNDNNGGNNIGECMTPEEANGALSLNTPICGLSGTDVAYYYYYVEEAGTLYFSIQGGRGNADLYFSNSGWPTDYRFTLTSQQQGNNELIMADVAIGWVYLMVKGEPDFSDIKLMVSNITPQLPDNTCIASEDFDGTLTAGQAVCVTSEHPEYFAYYVEDDSTLFFSTEGGEGDVNLYYSGATWASKDSYQQSSTNSGNREDITVHASKGWVYLTLDAVEAYRNVRVKVSTY
ncbi:Microbial collagenase, secreted [Moritella sp. JT01]|uniref:M9 family metallopeptidase n=1 Tax=Moritella sp. JT01 TaxID=756698 RepID=UPI0007915F3D|nr:M9 family metallopeptidase [Moritella sp. JT01]KXO14017.1 Microbial collagenase, secreted [Moritella sp. JT01]